MDTQTCTASEYAHCKQFLLKQAEESYQQFNAKLLNSNLPVLGIRVPKLKQIAKDYAKQYGESYLNACQTDTYEEALLYGLVLAQTPMEFSKFLTYCDHYSYQIVENWAHCDSFCSAVRKIVVKNESEFYQHIQSYLSAENPWAVRVGIIMLMTHYLKPEYLQEVIAHIDAIHSDFYYIEMAQAWLLATAWAKDSEAVRGYLPSCTLSISVKRKFVQKCCDSYRVTAEDKAYLRAWKKDFA